MSKVVAFLGSPRKNGFSNQLVHQVLEGAKSQGAEVVVYDLNENGVKGCQGCFYCRSHDGCATQDKLQPMYADLKDADGIVVSLPIYFHNITGQAKQWIDRLYPMLNADFSPRNPGKKIVSIYSQGNPDEATFQASIEQTNGIFTAFGWEVSDSILIGGTSAPNYALKEELMAQALNAGKKLTK